MSTKRRRENEPDARDVAEMVAAVREDEGMILKFEVRFDELGGVVYARAYRPGSVRRAELVQEAEKMFYTSSGLSIAGAAYHAGLNVYLTLQRARERDAKK